MHTLLNDVRFALRLMRKAPGFTVAVVLTLALAIGATTAIFTVVDATLVRGLPYRESDRLVQVTMTKAGSFDEMEASYPTFLDWNDRSTSFEYLAGYANSGGIGGFGTEAPRLLESAVVTADFFRVLGVEPALGTDFPSGDEDPADKNLALLSHGFWQRQFGGRPDVPGTSFVFNGNRHTVIGVLPADFEFAPIAPAEFFRPVERQPFQMRRNLHWLNVVGRLEPGVTIRQASSEMAALAERLGQLYPDSNKDTSTRIVTLRQAILGDVQPIMMLLLVAVGTLLLIATVNVASLMLARSADRQKEIAVRMALGAPRSRLIRQTLTEALMFSVAGALAGLVVAQWGLSALLAGIPESLLRFMPYLTDVQVDGRAVAFTAGITALTGVLFGLAPAVQMTRPRPQEALGDDVRTTAGLGTYRLRALLVGAQVALAVTLLAGAFLTTRSLFKMLEQDPGFEPQNLAALRVLFPQDRYPEVARSLPTLRQLQERLARLPGVEGIGVTNLVPFQAGNTVRFRLEHEAPGSAGEQAEASTRSVDASYLEVLQARLIRGRYFEARDEGDSPPVLIINRTLAEQHFPGQDPIGQRLVFTFAPDQPAREIVGVIEDVREGPLDAARRPALYNPLMRSGARVVDLVLRTSGAPAAHLAGAENALNQIAPGLLVLRRTTFDAVVAEAPWMFVRRYPATLTSIFAAVALLLAAVGLFGMISYLVAQRTREIAVRMALGAGPHDVLRLMMKQALGPALAGITVGVLCSLGLSRLAESMLFGVSAGDPVTFLLVPAIVGVTALMAVYLPARRAMKLDPVAALQHSV